VGIYRVDDPTLAGIQNQAVLRFTDANQRAQQVPNPAVGQLTFNAATVKFEWWNGTTWVALV